MQSFLVMKNSVKVIFFLILKKINAADQTRTDDPLVNSQLSSKAYFALNLLYHAELQRHSTIIFLIKIKMFSYCNKEIFESDLIYKIIIIHPIMLCILSKFKNYRLTMGRVKMYQFIPFSLAYR